MNNLNARALDSSLSFDESAAMMACYPPRLGQVCLNSDEQLEASIAETLARRKEKDIWLFAYGSLIWKPEGPSAERANARISGYHRGLNLWSRIHRGTPERPGLVLGLDQGGSCQGVVHRLPEHNLDQHLKALWQREMPDDSYRPEWLECRLADGRNIEALAFVLESERPNYAGTQPDSVVRQVIRQARGRCGSSRDYLRNTLSALRAQAMPDHALEATWARCSS
ncbi:Glutathione-specific gamma-glutamylcyclotransferase [Carnimonas sp. R-84981]|uniref:gamma-glutamylcyclotransferase n=1 Tax=Carnimonas bestiolae TaxID=3402172 RepID=UPI003EDCA449